MIRIEIIIILKIFFGEETFSLLVSTINAPGTRKKMIEQKNPPNKDIYDKISSKIAAINVAESITEYVTIIFFPVSISLVLKTNIKNEALSEL